MNVYILQNLTEAHFTRIGELLHMLDAGAPELDLQRLQAIMKDESFNLFVAEDEDGRLAGMLTLTRCHTLSGSKFWIEDVIVDPAYRGQGVGRALVHAAVEYVNVFGKTLQDRRPELPGMKPSLYLTSNPSRTAARALYRSEGFEEYETGVFRIV